MPRDPPTDVVCNGELRTSAGVKRTASQLAALGPDGLLLTPPAASADELGKPAPPEVRVKPAAGKARGKNSLGTALLAGLR
jgi:hypothetical protein